MVGQELREELGDLDLFQNVDLNEVQALLEACEEIQLAPGQSLLQPGQPNDRLYILLDGELTITLGTEGNPHITTLGRGACVGEMSILNREYVSAFVHTHTDCRLLVIEQDLLWQLINHSNGIARNLLYILSGRIRDDNDRLLESIEAGRRLEQIATVDALTGLYNRRWLDEMLPRTLKRCTLQELPLCLVMLDIDHFKRFNDDFGHPGGDRALASVARVMRSHLRPSDSAARYGGEEFMILMPEVALDEALHVAERLRRHIADEPIQLADQADTTRVSVSLGVAQSAPGVSVEALVEHADQALYRAKTHGRDRVES